MSRKHLLLAAILLGPSLARAASPTQGAYQYNIGLQPYIGANYITSFQMMWFDPSYTTVVPGGAPRPVSPDFPMPVAIVSGGGSSSGPTLGTPASPNTAGGVASATPPAAGQTGSQALSLDTSNNLRVTLGNTTVSLGAGTATIGGVTQSGTWNVGITGTVPVSGTFWQPTQPVSLASVPLAAGAATAANQTTPTAPGTSASAAGPIQGVTGGLPVGVSGSVISNPSTVTYTAPTTSAIATANMAVTVFRAGSLTHGCDIENTSSATLYIDFVATALAGAATSIALAPGGGGYHCPFPPTGAVTAVASTPVSFVAVGY